ncbi:MAG TPA: DUF4159 domain-containing protein [Vicinamibacterales bacterium]|nr:DUF4159 domain-containing protein [Vicinamibacterales bacterium]
MRAALLTIALAAATTAAVAGVAASAPPRFADQPPRSLEGQTRSFGQLDVQGNTPYDGRFVFVRLRYSYGFGGFGRRGGGPPWSHDYPRGEVHFTKILNEISYVRARPDGSNILGLDDPELFNYPIAYMAEPGFWTLTDKEAENFRAYLKKGGFIIFDDFREPEGHWDNLQQQMRRVLPDARWIEIDDGSHPVWHSFFEIADPKALAAHPTYAGMGLQLTYWGIFEDNDPKKRLLAIANVNGDLSEYWEFSDTGFAPVDLNNEAYKYGINYVIYGLTH